MACALWRQYAWFLSLEGAAFLPCKPAPEFPFVAEPRSEDSLPTTEIPPPSPAKSSLVKTCFGLGLALSALAPRAASATDNGLFLDVPSEVLADCVVFLD